MEIVEEFGACLGQKSASNTVLHTLKQKTKAKAGSINNGQSFEFLIINVYQKETFYYLIL